MQQTGDKYQNTCQFHQTATTTMSQIEQSNNIEPATFECVSSLSDICQRKIVEVLEASGCYGRTVHELCKFVPDDLLEPIFESLLTRGSISETALVAFLVPRRLHLRILGAKQIRNSIFKQIGLNCPHLTQLDLSGCVQVSNSVVRTVLQMCGSLQHLALHDCHRVTQAAFDPLQSPFRPLLGCLSLESVSLQGCPQVRGDIAATLGKHCRRLQHLNISQCQRVRSPQVQRLLEHRQLLSLNLAFLDHLCDEAFRALDPAPGLLAAESAAERDTYRVESPLQKLNLGRSRITDATLVRLSGLACLQEIQLQWCCGVSDAGIASLVAHSPLLSHIDLQSCSGVSDVALRAIAESCEHLRYLSLSWCAGFTAAGLRHLVHRFCETRRSDRAGDEEVREPRRRLEQLNLVWCLQVGDEQAAELAALPALRLVELLGSAVTAQGFAALAAKGVAFTS